MAWSYKSLRGKPWITRSSISTSKFLFLIGVIAVISVSTIYLYRQDFAELKHYILTEDVSHSIDFKYPFYMPNFSEVMEELRKPKNISSNLISKILPINLKYSSTNFLKLPDLGNEEENIEFLIIVKSSISNVDKRKAIRETWGSQENLKEFKCMKYFITGKENFTVANNFTEAELSQNDLIVADFMDTYSNLTYKTMMALKFASEEFPPIFKYLLLTDDDVYMDLENLQIFLNSFENRTFNRNYIYGSEHQSSFFGEAKNGAVEGKSILQNGLYLGKVLQRSTPIRGGSKPGWIASIEDYPYNYYPPYIPTPALVLSRLAVQKMYHSTPYIKHFHIDDVFLGIIAKKLEIISVHNPYFCTGYDGVKSCGDKVPEAIAIHGFQCPSQMVQFWKTKGKEDLQNCVM